MKNEDYWERFAKTGNIYDYLNYIACTSEGCTQSMNKSDEEGGYCGNSTNNDGDGFVSHAHWGL